MVVILTGFTYIFWTALLSYNLHTLQASIFHLLFITSWSLDLRVTQMVKSLPAMWEIQLQSLGQEDPWRRERLPTPVFLPGEFHGQRSLAGCSPWGCKESDTTERLTLSLSCIFLHVLFHMVYHRILTAVPCVHSRTMLFIHLYMDASANPKLRLHPSPSLHPLGNHKYVLYVCESKTAFCFANFMFVFYFDLASVWVKR